MDKYEGIAKLIFKGRRDKKNFELARRLCKSQELDSERIEAMITRAERLAEMERLAERLKEFASTINATSSSFAQLATAINLKQNKFLAGGYILPTEKDFNSGEQVIKKKNLISDTASMHYYAIFGKQIVGHDKGYLLDAGYLHGFNDNAKDEKQVY